MIDTETAPRKILGIPAGRTSPKRTIRYQLGNHLGSVSLELDENAAVISYEEYHPYGTTAYQAINSSIKAAAKRYRYTGMERDEETGLGYHSARYYVMWLGRWLSSDPKGISAGINLYGYVSQNPIILIDPNGKEEKRASPESFNREQILTLITQSKDILELTAKLGFSPMTSAEHLTEYLNKKGIGEKDLTMFDEARHDRSAEAKQKVIDEVLEPHEYQENRFVSRARIGSEESIAQAKESGRRQNLQTMANGLAFGGQAGKGLASKGLVQPRVEVTQATTKTYDSQRGAYKPEALPFGGALKPKPGAVKSMRGFQNEVEVTRITSGRLARDPKRPNNDLEVRYKLPNGQGGVARVDVIGPNGELIAVGGPAKEDASGKLTDRLTDLKRAADTRGVKAKAYFTNDTNEKELNEARSVLGVDNVHTFERPNYKYP